MNTMAAARRRRRRLFPLRPRALLTRRLLLTATAAGAAGFTFLFLAVMLLSHSPSSPPSRHHVNTTSSPSPPPHHCSGGTASLGELGDAMVSMLPTGLAFTVFAPSADAFRRVLNLRPNASAARAIAKQRTAGDGGGSESEDTYAVLSRVLGFSAVPRRLLAADVPGSVSVVLDSVSGLQIHVARDGAAIVANGVRSECVDVVRGETVVHVMAGVLMDAEFERSFAL